MIVNQYGLWYHALKKEKILKLLQSYGSHFCHPAKRNLVMVSFAKELMESTYVLRRRQILSGLAIPVGKVVAKYPPLCQLSHVSMRSDYL
jgi:hypothetical protein